MLHALVNLTLPVVMQEIDHVLDEYPEYPYRLAFSIHKLRQKLIAHVLSHVPNRYTIEGEHKSFSSLESHYAFPEAERLRIEITIRAGILNILRENADWLSHTLPQLQAMKLTDSQ